MLVKENLRFFTLKIIELPLKKFYSTVKMLRVGFFVDQPHDYRVVFGGCIDL